MIKNLKSLGFSERFIKKVENSYKRIPAKTAAFEKCIDSVFNRPSINKTKRKKAEPKPVSEEQPQPEVEDTLNDENDEEDTIQGEDYTMDVEVDPDDDDEAVNEEEFIDND